MQKYKKLKLNDFSLTISSFAIQAMLYEAACIPSPVSICRNELVRYN